MLGHKASQSTPRAARATQSSRTKVTHPIRYSTVGAPVTQHSVRHPLQTYLSQAA